jgi:hypothetical protein
LRVFFDNCTAPTLASTLDGFLKHSGSSAYHIKDLPCGRDAADVEWIQMLAADPPGTWIVITGDGRIRKNPAERLAYRQAQLGGFVLAPAFQKTPMNQVASFLLWRWPDVEQLARLTRPPYLFELPMHKGSKISPLPL